MFLFDFEERIALSSKGGGADRNEGPVGGIPFKEDPNAPRLRSGGPVGGAAGESKNAPGKGTFRRGGLARDCDTARYRNAFPPVMLLPWPTSRVGE